MTTLKDIHDEVKELRGEVQSYAKVSNVNQNDLKWVKDGGKVLATAVVSHSPGLLLWFFKGG